MSRTWITWKAVNYEYKISYKFIDNAEVIKITSSAS